MYMHTPLDTWHWYIKLYFMCIYANHITI